MKNIFTSAASKLAIVLAGIATISVGCTAGFEDINNPKENLNFTELSKDNYQEGSFLIQLQNNAFPEQENAYQMNHDLIGNYLGRYMTYANDGFKNNNFAKFNAPEGWAAYPFRDRTPKIESAFNEIKRIATKEDLSYQWASLLRISGMLVLTDQYGPFPIGANPEDIKAYSSQKDIYMTFLKDLDECITYLEGFNAANQGKKFFVGYDHIYGGDFSKWLKYANSLKLRLAIRIRFVEPAMAQKLAEEAVKSGVMVENSDNLAITYVPNGQYKTSVEWGDSRACADIDSYMNGYNDPRIEKYFSPTAEAGSRKIIGCLAGADIGNKKIAVRLYSAANVEQATKGVWMCAAESYFNRAEGATLGWNMNGEAEELYNEGIKASFEQWGVGSADKYLNDNKSRPADYTDAEGGYGQSMPAASNITIKWDNNASSSVKQERISVQKWIAMFPNGQEAWNEIRRTGYPKIFSITTSTNGFNLKTPNRIPLDPQEKIRNPKNYAAAVQTLGGNDDYGTKLWWQK